MKFKTPDNITLINKLERPSGKVHIVLDTDTFNEIDDQYALAYALKKQDRVIIDAIYAAPFFNKRSTSPKHGMERSYEEIQRILPIMNRMDLKDKVYKGSEDYLVDEDTPQESAAAKDLVARVNALPEGELLYVVAIGAITNIASAILMDPTIVDKIVLVWLGGHAHYWHDNKEFNLIQDVAAARVVFDCGVPLVQLPCMGVVSHLATTEPELREWLKGKNAIGDYLYDITCGIASIEEGKVWSRVIWDVAPLVWLAGPEKCMEGHLCHSPIVSYDGYYSVEDRRHLIKVVDFINRDKVFEELFDVLTQ